MPMGMQSFTRRIYIICITLMLVLAGCASEVPIEDKASKDNWIKKSYGEKKAPGKTSTLIKLPGSLRFRDHILKGKLAHGMNFQDALATLRMKPYGTREQKTVFWCDATRIQRCSDQCVKCEAMLFGENHIAMLEGFGKQFNVNNFYPAKFSDFYADVNEMSMEFADQIYRREIHHGMPGGVVQMIINLAGHQTTWYCDKDPQPATGSCIGQCETCRADITPRSSGQKHQSVYLTTQNNQQTVTDIIDR